MSTTGTVARPVELPNGHFVPLAEASRTLIPIRRDGKPIHAATLIRWATRGIRSPGGLRVYLRAKRVGGQWFVTSEAVDEFLEAQKAQPDADGIPPRTPGQRRRASERAAAELKAAGI